jgi:multiple sugar transport system ATP-binding protein
MAEIVLRDVEKYFGDNYIIRKLNLEIRNGEFVVLLGPSGCGKTTTLRAIAGLEDIDSGDILIDGKPVQQLQAADRDIAFVFQLFALYPHLTAYSNIAFPLRAMNESKATIDQRVREVAKALRIEHLLDKRPSALSGGDMQRVAIGRALVRRPKAMLMDEPIGALDAKLREEMRAELKHIHIQNGATTVYVTHDQVEAMAMADKIAIMNEGVLQQVGTPSDVYQHPANLFVAQFIGSPIMNVVNASVRPGDGFTTVTIGEDDAALRFPNELYHKVVEHKHTEDELAVGIRPEGVQVARAATDGYIPVEAHIIEPLGPYDIVDLKFGKQLLRARTTSGYVEKAGDVVWARLDEKQTHFFSTRTGESLHIRM